jgi:predicted transposase YbfD/YdcC
MGEIKCGSVWDHFSTLTDPRDSNKRHKLFDIIVIAICAVICGADTWEQMEEYGQAKYEWLQTFLELPHGIPSHDTISRVFSQLIPEEFERCFLNWISAVREKIQGQFVSIDGKTLRRSHDHGSEKSCIHMVSAWASANRLVLGQLKTEDKSNEITAIPELIDLLELDGCIVTIDAMGCQKRIAEQITDKGADYVLALKGNQGNLHKDVELFFEDAKKNGFGDTAVSAHETTDGDHGRIEIRRYTTVSDIDWLPDKPLWKDLTSIGMVESERHIGDEVSTETRYYISSLQSDAKLFGQAVRSHWGVENSLHWVLDMVFREDESRIRKGHAPENFAILRHIALNLLRKESTYKKSTKTKRLRAAWDEQYLARVLSS